MCRSAFWLITSRPERPDHEGCGTDDRASELFTEAASVHIVIETGERELPNPEGDRMLRCFELEPDISPATAERRIDNVCVDTRRVLVHPMRQHAAHNSAIDEEYARIAGVVNVNTLPAQLLVQLAPVSTHVIQVQLHDGCRIG